MNNDRLYFVAKFSLDGAAFEEGQGWEISRILRAMAEEAESWPIERKTYKSIRDENGNSVGIYGIKAAYDLNI